MKKWLQHRIKKSSRKREALKRATEVFELEKNESSHQGLSSIIDYNEIRCIVRICYGHTKPPRRAFYSVPLEGKIKELNFNEVTQYGEELWL